MKWFKVNNIENGVYAISEPYHWEKARSYLFVGKDKAILVDTGTGLCPLKPITDMLTELPITVILTHCHWDHISSINSFNEVYIHLKEESWLKNGLPLSIESIRNTISSGGYDSDKCPNFDLNKYTVPTKDSFHILKGGEIMSNGVHELEVIHTPGHSPGSIALYEKILDILVTGDLLYKGTIYANYPSTDPEQLYKSYLLIKNYQPKWVYPGHNDDMIGGSLIMEGSELLEKLDSLGKLKHGTGNYHSEHISFKF
ncbi:MAG: MBL fold metallo-hydrolase [gamma proteobacterium symbiont of Lucinoma myriamae]|nr:MBL fold metallo-hydrolase [gamma proteobacterium symbiont of Lucinoma myriamae]